MNYPQVFSIFVAHSIMKKVVIKKTLKDLGLLNNKNAVFFVITYSRARK